MKYAIAVVDGGFLGLYLNFFKKICVDNNVLIDIFDKYEDVVNNLDMYDYVLSDCNPNHNSCNVFHHNTVLYQLSKSNNILYSLIYYVLHLDKIKKEALSIKSCNKIIVVSNEVKRDLQKFHHVPSEKIIVANAGFIVPEQNNDNKKIKRINSSEPFILCTNAFGFITKGGYTLLGAIRKFRKMYPSIKIKANIIYPKYKTNLAVKFYVKFFKLSDTVEFFGYQEDINAFYEQAHCLTCQSVYEAFGRVVPEAMYQKIPVIVGSNVGASDIIQDGVNGFVFEDNKNRLKNLAMKIKEVYDRYNNLESLVENAYKTAKNSTWKNFATNIFYALYPEFKKRQINM